MFERALTPSSRLLPVVTTGTQIALGLFVLSGIGSGYRAIAPPTLVLEKSGQADEVFVRVQSTGRGVVDLRIELQEAGRSRLLSKRIVPGRRFPVFNPLPVREELEVTLPPDRGPAAVLRATAIPSSQWLWQPPAIVRTIACPARRTT